MPVLPEVPSIIVPPGFNFPARSASSTILIAMRSLIELPGLNVSIFATTVASVASLVIRLMRTRGVLPMVSRMLSQIFLPGGFATSGFVLGGRGWMEGGKTEADGGRTIHHPPPTNRLMSVAIAVAILV